MKLRITTSPQKMFCKTKLFITFRLRQKGNTFGDDLWWWLKVLPSTLQPQKFEKKKRFLIKNFLIWWNNIIWKNILYTNVELKYKRSSRLRIIFSQFVLSKNAIWPWDTLESKCSHYKWVVPNYKALNTSFLRQGSRRSWLVNKVSMLAS